MKISEMIEKLEEIKKEHGDLPVEISGDDIIDLEKWHFEICKPSWAFEVKTLYFNGDNEEPEREI